MADGQNDRYLVRSHPVAYHLRLARQPTSRLYLLAMYVACLTMPYWARELCRFGFIPVLAIIAIIVITGTGSDEECGYENTTAADWSCSGGNPLAGSLLFGSVYGLVLFVCFPKCIKESLPSSMRVPAKVMRRIENVCKYQPCMVSNTPSICQGNRHDPHQLLLPSFQGPRGLFQECVLQNDRRDVLDRHYCVWNV